MKQACGETSAANGTGPAPERSRRKLLTILASAAAVLASPRVRAQRALSTPRGTGQPPIARRATLPPAQDLAADAGRSARERRPILLFFDRAECPYCERALREYLVPLAQDEWKDRAIFRQVEIDLALPVRLFDGTMTTHAALATRYGVSLSPTVVFVDAGGNVLAGPVVGLMPDFYGAYLEDALAQAMRRLAN